MYEGLLIVLVPMFFGYLIKTQNQTFLSRINQIVMYLLYGILFIMGFKVGQLDDLSVKLPIIAFSAFVFALCIQSLNLMELFIYDKFSPIVTAQNRESLPSRWRLLLDSIKLCSMVFLGFLVGFFSKSFFHLPKNSSTAILVILIFFIGVQLRNNGISLKEVFLNRRGITTGLIFMATSLLGGVIAALVLHLPITQGLAIASGFGWYSLSSVVITDAWDAMFGSIAFFNDLSREIVSLFLIPFLMQQYRSTAVGISGATSLDCSLPIIQRAGGVEVVPLAISFGFVTNITPPILLVLFSSIPLS